MSAIKAIETKYKGYLFRSRLEARWAVFFDALGLKWEYEKEGYDLGAAGWYLPDFFICHGEGSWIEVKPQESTFAESFKVWALEQQTKIKACVVIGIPGWLDIPDVDDPSPRFADVERFESYPLDDEDGKMLIQSFLADPEEYGGAEKIALMVAYKTSLLLDVYGSHFDWLWPNKIRFSRQEYDDAIEAARSARFEHGQLGGR